jgi:hypothetical protein
MFMTSLPQNLYWKETSHAMNNANLISNTVDPGYNDTGLYDTSYITSDILFSN